MALLLALLTLIAQVFVVFSLVMFISGKRWEWLSEKIENNNILLAFAVAFTAMSGSLFFSQIMKLEPCELCWFQRIFMYPQAFILAVAYLKKDQLVEKYILTLSFAGILISAYHYYIQMFNQPTFCSINIPCSVIQIINFGYITIPMMALTAFATLITVFTIYKKR